MINSSLQPRGIDEKLPIKMTWCQSVSQVGYFMIVKNAPNKDTAVKFLKCREDRFRLHAVFLPRRDENYSLRVIVPSKPHKAP